MVAEELLELCQYVMMAKREMRNSGKIVKKSIGNEAKISCERELCRKVDMA